MKEIISKINKNNVYVILDFDRTITAEDSADSWDASGKLLGKEFAEQLNKLYKIYRPIELDYSISMNEKEKAMVTWYGECMDLYLKYNLTQQKVKESVQKSDLIYRKGAKEFLEKLAQEKIPVIILSAGIGNVIKEFLQKTNCYFDNMYIISNFLEFDETGKMKKFDNTKIIHTLNKTMNGKLPKEFQSKIKNRTYKILVGDLIEDEKMVEKEEWNTTLKVAMLDKPTKENINLYKENFDLVLIKKEADFRKISELLF